ncbi:DUF3221 domain-containing protein [Evansella tamaricis]|uniref:YobA family protein n=1 Tax=Evansella tamaricis TaxID=2069301 RepID=A0ABS6J9M7_9BACI|nr:DUF3221 domain-containing protein [Evansella tamaricis]MBU9710290.1 YobA family protein [Evansella tamaricis]
MDQRIFWIRAVGAIVFILIYVSLSGCLPFSNDNVSNHEPMYQEGRIVEIEARILVVSDISKEEAIEFDESSILSNEVGTNATWFSVDDVEQYSEGQLVRVYYRGMDESYPGQSEATKIENLEE